jgi:hypothetical protein
MVTKILLSGLIDIEYWLEHLCDDIIDLVMMIFMAYIFRIRNSDANGYTPFTVDGSSVSSTPLQDLEGGPNLPQPSYGEIGRNQSIPIPVYPNIITVSSPDGTEEVIAQEENVVDTS